MKKIIITLAAAFIALSASAQVGIIAGLTSSQSDLKTALAEVKSVNQYHVGVAYHQDLMMGFSIQPAIIYNMKGTEIANIATITDANIDYKTGYLEVPVQIQWGIDLAVAKPFVFAEPFIGYAINNISEAGKTQNTNWDNIKSRFEYGVGLGAGVDVLKHLQVSVRYFWNLGNIYGSDISIGGVTKTIGESKCTGIMASAAIFF
ncbi:MAG: PorT family protein [Bacteroidales bacterium]|nr:PorT family protein [Bacteroidales bacterium]